MGVGAATRQPTPPPYRTTILTTQCNSLARTIRRENPVGKTPTAVMLSPPPCPIIRHLTPPRGARPTPTHDRHTLEDVDGASRQHAAEVPETRSSSEPERGGGLPPFLPPRWARQSVHGTTTVTGLQGRRNVGSHPIGHDTVVPPPTGGGLHARHRGEGARQGKVGGIPRVGIPPG